jgi:hypothetical protein
MRDRTQRRRTVPLFVSAAALSLATGALGHASVAAQAQGAAAATPQAQAPIDLTGNWVSVVTEDWRWRMVTPPKGDYSSVPLNPEGRRVADTWDPAKDTADGNACRSYGVGGIMRVPGRLQISWQDPNTLKILTDAGQQTRLLHFGDPNPPSGNADWQGYSSAVWEVAGARGGFGGGAAPPRGGDLKVETTHMKAGYVRKNGVPYSENATLLEYFDRHREPNGDEWFTVTTILHDPKYYMQDFITSTHFKKEPDASKWRPTPCTAS